MGCKAKIQDRVAMNFNAVKEGKILSKNSTLYRTTASFKLKTKVATGRDLTDINKTVLAKLEARTVLCKDYGSGSLATIAVLDAARRYARRHK